MLPELFGYLGFASKADLQAQEKRMNQQFADFKARMDEKFAAANKRLDSIAGDEEGLKNKQAELQKRIDALEAGGTLGAEEIQLMADLEAEQEGINARLATLDEAVPAVPAPGTPATPAE